MALTASSTGIRRAPNGLDSSKPVPVRFTAEERARHKRIAETEQRSLASVVRLLALKGAEVYDRDPSSLLRGS